MRQNARKNLSTGIYVRVSTEEQAQEGFSIRAQIEKLKSYALLKDWDIFDIYTDEGISGKNIVERPAINRLIADIESGKVNNVLVFKVDRLTRSTKNLLELVELFEDCNCAFNSLTESIDTETPSGRMFLKIIGIFAEFERENLASRLKLGFERKVKEGYTLATNHISYGYTREKGERVQTIEPEEARIVKEIFSMFVEKNMAMHKIAKTLNERKVPTKTGIGLWDGTSIKSLLTNPTYIGKVRYSVTDENKYFEADGQHEPILSDKVFYLAQERVQHISQRAWTKHPREKSYFCGFLICGMCGSKYTTHNYTYKTDDGVKHDKASYHCRKRLYNNGVPPCQSPSISHEKMELAFIEYIQNINDIAEDSDISAEEIAKKAEQELLTSIVECEKRLSKLHDRKKQVMEQYVQGVLEFDEYKSMIKVFNEQSEALDSELQSKKAELETMAETPRVYPEDIIADIRLNWEHLSNREKMIFLQRFVKSITISVEKKNINTSVVKIDSIEFHTGELDTRGMVRSKLRQFSYEGQSEEISPFAKQR